MEIAQESVASVESGHFLACQSRATQTPLTCPLQLKWLCGFFVVLLISQPLSAERNHWFEGRLWTKVHLGAGCCEPCCPVPPDWMGIQQVKKIVLWPVLEEMWSREGVSPSCQAAQQVSEPWSHLAGQLSVQDPSQDDVDGLGKFLSSHWGCPVWQGELLLEIWTSTQYSIAWCNKLITNPSLPCHLH